MIRKDNNSERHLVRKILKIKPYNNFYMQSNKFDRDR